MALTRLTDWQDGQVLTAAALKAEFDNIYNNGMTLISPAAATLNMNGNLVTGLSAGSVSAPGLSFTSDSNTGLYASAADTVDIASGGVRSLKLNTAAIGVNYLDITPAATGAGPVLLATGSDTNVPLTINTKADGDILLKTGGVTALNLNYVASGVNYVEVLPAAAGSGPTIDAVGSDTDIALNLDTKAAGAIVFKTAGTERKRVNTYSRTTSFAVVTANQTLTQSNTTLQNITDLVFPLEASFTYSVKVYLSITGANTTHDIKIGWTVPASCTMRWGPSTLGAGTGINSSYWLPMASTSTNIVALLTEAETIALGTIAGTVGAVLYADVINSTNAGNLQLQASQNTSSGSDCIILKHSRMEITRLQAT
jgi:hypothetical protein